MNFRGVKSCGLALALAGASLFPALAQDRFEDGYLQSALSMENGLPCNFIDDVCLDDAGFLWLATSGGGLCRFDGYDLLSFGATSGTPLKSNFIRNICEDRFHRLWIASEGRPRRVQRPALLFPDAGCGRQPVVQDREHAGPRLLR